MWFCLCTNKFLHSSRKDLRLHHSLIPEHTPVMSCSGRRKATENYSEFSGISFHCCHKKSNKLIKVLKISVISSNLLDFILKGSIAWPVLNSIFTALKPIVQNMNNCYFEVSNLWTVWLCILCVYFCVACSLLSLPPGFLALFFPVWWFEQPNFQ